MRHGLSRFKITVTVKMTVKDNKKITTFVGTVKNLILSAKIVQSMKVNVCVKRSAGKIETYRMKNLLELIIMNYVFLSFIFHMYCIACTSHSTSNTCGHVHDTFESLFMVR